jgi:hypothetical protein
MNKDDRVYLRYILDRIRRIEDDTPHARRTWLFLPGFAKNADFILGLGDLPDTVEQKRRPAMGSGIKPVFMPSPRKSFAVGYRAR